MTRFIQKWRRARCTTEAADCWCLNRLCANRLEADEIALLAERIKAHKSEIRVYETSAA